MDCTVSIVIPTYNRRHTLVKVIDSYLCQKYVKEIIFVNDGSTDDTGEYLKGLQNEISNPVIRVETHSQKLGAPRARNTGIKVASGDFIMIGEDDVILSEDYVFTLLKCLDETGADIITGRILYNQDGETFDDTINRCNTYKRNVINYWAMSVLHSIPFPRHMEAPFSHALGLGKAKIYKKILFSPDFIAREETDFYIRAGKAGAKLVLCPHTMCFHLPQDKNKGGGWSIGAYKYQYIATRNNNMLINRHYDYMKKWGMKGNKFTFKLIHLLNRARILYKYYRLSAKH